MISRILVTGATGFVGKALMRRLREDSREAIGTVRTTPVVPELMQAPELSAVSDWRPFLAGCDAVVHTAARVHVLRETAADPLAVFREINTAATLSLARQAAASGVRRFLFVSSIKVNGERTEPGRPFTEKDHAAPQDAYAISKTEAEQGLLEIAAATGLEVVIVRPPLVYGRGVKANFRTLMQWLHQGVPLPLGAIRNRRSLVALDNLIDLVVTCIDHPAAANQVFLAGDGEDLSTPELLQRLGTALGRPARLLAVPPPLLAAGTAVLGKREIGRRLWGSLQADIGKARMVLGWKPPMSVDDALHVTARHFLEDSVQ